MPTVVNMGHVFRVVRETAASRELGQEAADWLARRLPAEATRRTDWTRTATHADVDQDFDEAVPQEVAAACRRHVQRAVAQGEPLARFQAGHATAEVAPVADWLASLPDEDPTLLAKLFRVTWAQAVGHSRRWHERLTRRDANAVSDAVLGQGASVTLELADRWRWVRLETVAALDAEGQAMGHCVGSGGYDKLIKATAPDGIYSLRDARGRPRVTVEVSDGDVEQAQGRGNTEPTGYVSGLQALVQALGVGIGEACPAGLFGLARLGGALMPVDEALARLAANGKVVGAVDFRGCASLTRLPDGLEVGGNLDLDGCTSLARLPDGLVVGGYLHLGGCAYFTSLPKGLKVGGSLSIDDCTSLISLPEGLKVGGYLHFRGCTSLASLPEGFKVVGSLYLGDCTALTSLPEGLAVGSNLGLRGCVSLASLPEGLEVGGDLQLSGCTALTSLPEELKVGGYLDLLGCVSLTSLPEELKVGGYLDIRCCSSLKSLPEGLVVGDRIHGADHLPWHPAITQSPDTMMTR